MDSKDLADCSPESSGELAYEVLTEENDLLQKLKLIEPVVKEVMQSSGELFSWEVSKRGNISFQATKMGKRLLTALKNGSGEFYCHFPLHALNPYVALLFECAERFDSILLLSSTTKLSSPEVKKEVGLLNSLVDSLRAEGSSHEFRTLIRGFVRAEKKRSNSLDQYISALFVRHSRMVVIRVDLSYRTGILLDRKHLNVDLAQVAADWTKLRQDLHRGQPIKGMLGFACKLEYGHLKGFHFHLLIFYNGAKYREDIVLADLIGEHWAQNVTGGRGMYYNCNKKKNEYQFPGIGVINWFDKDLVSNLKSRVAAYLVKTDYWVRLSAENGRSFFRGNMPKLSGLKKGRPRGSVTR
jgi:hypothetical protein